MVLQVLVAADWDSSVEGDPAVVADGDFGIDFDIGLEAVEGAEEEMLLIEAVGVRTGRAAEEEHRIFQA